MQPQLGPDLVLQPVLMAMWQPRNSVTVALNSDRGTQCAAQEFQAFLQTYGIVSSTSGVGNGYDNAVAESFFGLLKRERVHRRQHGPRAEARADVFGYIKQFYNYRRSHSCTQGLAPRNFVGQHGAVEKSRQRRSRHFSVLTY
ncbi:MAG: hypothetical protein NPIRA06_22350 [Nitrospirales bacterium]|nr:MAG: hypothetical protein NPIRA06_22350 [Nitrospirales bacterium]